MISVRFYRDSAVLSVSVTDHAEPTVCAAVCSLEYAIACEAMKLYEQGMIEQEPIIQLEPGDTFLYVKPGKMRGEMEALFDAVEIAMRKMEESYPGQIEVKDSMATLDDGLDMDSSP